MHNYAGNLVRDIEHNPSLKRQLYIIRILLTGIYALRTGNFNRSLNSLIGKVPEANDFSDYIKGLIEVKYRKETQLYPLDKRGRELFGVLESSLHRAYSDSPLPEEVGNIDNLNDFLIQLRTERRYWN